MLMNQRTALAIFALAVMFSSSATAQEDGLQPQIPPFKTVGTAELKAHVFLPADSVAGKSHAAIILLHGGGWNAGSPEWVFDDARHFASLGMVAIAGEYRSSDQKTITPLDAMSDVRDLIRWVRNNAADFDVSPN